MGILDRKLDCMGSLRYGGFACVVVEERGILKLLAGEAQASMTFADWQAVDAKLEECMHNARRIIPYEAQPVAEVPSSSAAPSTVSSAWRPSRRRLSRS